MTRFVGGVCAWAIVVCVAGCQPASPPVANFPGAQTGRETQALLTALAAADFKATPSQYQPVPAPYLHAPVTAVTIGEESLAIWEYPNAEAAADDAQRISPRGVDGAFLELGSEARWFKRDRLLVLYLGRSSALRAMLRERLGHTFVGPPA